VPAKGKTSLFKLSAKETEQVLAAGNAPKLRETDFPELLVAARCNSYILQVDRANLYFEQERDEHAFRCIAQAIDMEPAEEEAWRVRASFMAQIGRLSEGMNDINQAIRLDADQGVSYLLRAEIWKAMGNDQNYCADRTRALSLQPELAELEIES
jgi:Tfp pilus assembly protein PilF